ncbi:hypothetical protein Pmar_PMAR005057, partial [Perkinsus marinus ATCC 50983]
PVGEERILRRRLDQQRRRVEDMSEMLSFSREEKQKLELEIKTANVALDESQSLLNDKIVMKEILEKELFL